MQQVDTKVLKMLMVTILPINFRDFLLLLFTVAIKTLDKIQ